MHHACKQYYVRFHNNNINTMNRLCSCIHHERSRNFTSFLPTANILQLVSIFVKKGILFLVKLNLLIGASIKKNMSINITGWRRRCRICMESSKSRGNSERWKNIFARPWTSVIFLRKRVVVRAFRRCKRRNIGLNRPVNRYVDTRCPMNRRAKRKPFSYVSNHVPSF